LTSGTLWAQGILQSINVKQVDVIHLANGYRASKIIGAPVFNSEKDNIGTIDDLIINPHDSAPYAILSIGGFLSIGTHLVTVPWSSLQIIEGKMQMPSATTGSLKKLPEFKYTR